MNAIKKHFNEYWKYWLFAVLLGFILPVFLVICHAPILLIVILDLLFVNIFTSVVYGNLIKSNRLPFWFIFLFPILFLITAISFLPSFTFGFAAVYLCLAYLVYSMSRIA